METNEQKSTNIHHSQLSPNSTIVTLQNNNMESPNPSWIHSKPKNYMKKNTITLSNGNKKTTLVQYKKNNNNDQKMRNKTKQKKIFNLCNLTKIACFFYR